MSSNDLNMLCTEGSTSKHFGSLQNGGRGRALEAVRAISDLSFESSCDNSGQAFKLSFQSDTDRQIIPTSRPKGTTVLVQSIFKDHPVRRFYALEHKQQQTQEVLDVTIAFAIATNLIITLTVDSKVLLRANQESRCDRVGSLFGDSKCLLHSELQMESWLPNAKAQLFTLSPTSTSSGKIILSVNGRPCISAPLFRAIRSAFKVCANTRSPSVAIFIEAQRESYDYLQGSPLISVVFSSAETFQNLILDSLSDLWRSASETLSFKSNSVSPASSPQISSGRIESVRSFSTHQSNKTVSLTTANIIKLFQNAKEYKYDPGESHESVEARDFESMEVIGQWNRSFIILRNGCDIYAIDQHAACESVNFEKIRKGSSEAKQPLISPIVINASPEDLENAELCKEQCSDIGFEYEVKDGGIIVTTVPVGKSVCNGASDLQELLGAIRDFHQKNPVSNYTRRRMAYRACHSSVRAGDIMSNAMMKSLLKRMSSSDYPWNCPHGRPTWCSIWSLKEVEGRVE